MIKGIIYICSTITRIIFETGIELIKHVLEWDESPTLCTCHNECWGGLFHIGDSDNSNSNITNGRNIDLLGGDFLTVKDSVWILTDKRFLYQNLPFQPGGCRIHIDRSITCEVETL